MVEKSEPSHAAAGAAGSTQAVRLRGVFFRYGGRLILEGIDLDIEAGHFTVLLGCNGSGKSTLFRLIAGFLPIPRDGGTIELFGLPAAQLSGRRRAERIGFLPQHHRPVFPFSVLDVVLTGRAGRIRFMPTGEDAAIARRALDRIGIGHLADRLFTELSGGEQQLAMIARLLAQEPQLILLDEPINHLDLAYQAKVLGALADLRAEGYTIMAILHDPNIATLFADRLICLQNGKMFADSGRDSTLAAAVLQAVYGISTIEVDYQGKTLIFPHRARPR
jgi:iron complex transport system ATP-binding protein